RGSILRVECHLFLQNYRDEVPRMCTVSWLHTPNGYHLLFNRDENPMAKPALPPEIQHSSGMRFIAPIDIESGGSLVAANEAGVSFGLINRSICSRCNAERKSK